MGVRITDRNAILARTDLPTDELKLANPQSGSYQHIGSVPTLAGPVPIKGSWLAVDAKTRGKTYRFITTHLLGPVLDGSPDPLLPLQAQELLAGPANTDLPTLIVGDLNSTPSDPTHGALTGAGFTDEWDAAHPGDPGSTAFQSRPAINNPVSTLSNRIDYVWARGPVAPLDMHLVGADPLARTASGLWPSDHAGVVATLAIGPQAMPTGQQANEARSGTSSAASTSSAPPSPVPTGR